MSSKPILKWVGGKTQIIDKLIAGFPREMNNYHEPFLGGGSVLLTLLSHVKRGVIKIHGNIFAYDLNEPLIYMYRNIQSNHHELYHTLQFLIAEFNECPTHEEEGPVNRNPQNIQEAKLAKETYYYWIRSEYNALSSIDKRTILGSAMFIFMNKTCFRGIFRVGPNGFNVPYGHNKNPEIINEAHLEEIHQLIQNVIFECADFSTSLSSVEPGDFVYLDPPYAPETSRSFVKYTENGFNLEDHHKLFNALTAKATTRATSKATVTIKWMMSNSDTDLVKTSFPEDKYKITPILCKRKINSKNPDATAMEVIITNY